MGIDMAVCNRGLDHYTGPLDWTTGLNFDLQHQLHSFSSYQDHNDTIMLVNLMIVKNINTSSLGKVCLWL